MRLPKPKGIPGIPLHCEDPWVELPGCGPDLPLLWLPETMCDAGERDEDAMLCADVGTRALDVDGSECDRRVSWGAMHAGVATLEGPAPLCADGSSRAPSSDEYGRFGDARDTEGVGTET